MSRIPLDSSGASSTNQNIRNFIKDTELSDNSLTSTGPSLESSGHKHHLNTIHEESKNVTNSNANANANANVTNSNVPIDPEIVDEYNLNLPIGDESPETEDHQNFHKNVKYLLNQDFQGSGQNDSMAPSTFSPPNSIPNTFKNKSHPNAKTKSLLGLLQQYEEEHTQESSSEHPHELHDTQPDDPHPIKTSTINKSPQLDNTPEWMPSELNERWADEFHSSVKINKNPSLTFQMPSTSNSVVHNSKNSLKTPMWKKVKGNYDQTKLQPQLHQFFNNSDKSHSMSSTLSTPYNSMKQNQLTKEQVAELQTLLENGKDKPDDYVIGFPDNVSPLKLWGNNYNTFTKGKLNEIIHNLQAPTFNLNTDGLHNTDLSHKPDSNNLNYVVTEEVITNNNPKNSNDILEQDSIFNDSKPSNSHNNNGEDLILSQLLNFNNELDHKPLPKLKNKAFNADLGQHYKQRANDLFDNIQKRGVILKPSNSKSISNNFNQANNSSAFAGAGAGTTTATATATSTPKLNKVNNIDSINEYSSFSSDFDQDSTQFNNNLNNQGPITNNAYGESQYQQAQFDNSGDYTSITESNSETHSNFNSNAIANEHQLPDNAISNSDIKSVSNSHLSSPSYSQHHQQHQHHQRSPKMSHSSPIGKNYSKIPNGSSPSQLHNLNRLSDANNSSYTFDQFDTDDMEYSSSQAPRYQKYDQQSSFIDETNNDYKLGLEHKIKELESKLNSLGMYQNNMEALINENNNLRLELRNQSVDNDMYGNNYHDNNHTNPEDRDISIDDYDLTNEISQQEIKLKTLSQLRLQHLNNVSNIQNTHTPPMGFLKPDPKLPVHYENMVLDETNHRWIPKGNKENYSLDSIEDLLSNDDGMTSPKENSIIGEQEQEQEQEGLTANESNDETFSSNPPNMKAKEVSFHLPHSEQVKSSPMAMDTTRVSQLEEISFTQQQKQLVSIITDSLINTKSNWSRVLDISLLNKNLININDLKDFLPNLLKVDVSHNSLKYLKGLPNNLINLNLSNNKVDNLTSLKDFLNLQHLNLSNNYLTNGNSLKYNIHLTKLNLSNNKINSMEGLKNLTNLISLDLSQNQLKGEIDFKYFKFDNLQELILSDNQLVSLVNVDKLDNLRILNANENNLTKLIFKKKHLHLKKLLLKLNRLRHLSFHDFPYLRTLRIDGNNFDSISGKARYLEELSVKSQSNDFLPEFMNYNFDSLKTLDISGNVNFFNTCNNRFLNVNKLTLSAINLTKLPKGFGEVFPNVMELNLNFNQLHNLSELKAFKNLKRLYLVSNNLIKIEQIVSNLINSRLSLKVLDLRLNAINVEFYPYLFNPQESELRFSPLNKATAAQQLTSEEEEEEEDNLPIQLETLDDIENFAIHYESLNNHDNTDWEIRDKVFINSLKSNKIKRRINYQTLLINYFPNLKKLDGFMINFDKRLEFENNLKAISQ